MLWLRDQGYEVTGVEMVRQAVETFFEENQLAVKTHEHENFCLWQSDQLQILEGDFFALPENIIKSQLYYDRAALVSG